VDTVSINGLATVQSRSKEENGTFCKT